LYNSAGIDTEENKGYYFQLSKINLDTKKEEIFLPEHKELVKMQSVSVIVPDGEWKLSVNSAIPNRIFGDIGLLALLGFLLSVLAAVFAYRFATRPKKLNELVLNRTSELNASENNYRSLIERVSDAFIALDSNWCYTYVNEKAGEILERHPEDLIGKNIWQEFPHEAEQAFKEACYRAMETQEYHYLEEYYPPVDKWFENNIYPSSNGLTVFFKDVTDIKQITQALKNNEEKYRTLIEHASDGIVITDMEGFILEINKSIPQMIGYPDEEIIGHHLSDFLPEEEMDKKPLRIHELMQGKSLLYERRLLRKDGTFLDVEINSKMASSHTLIGFIRDIAERKNAERALKKSNERFELIANATNDAIWDHDYEKNETWGNNKLYELYGLEPGKEKINFEMFIQHIQPDQKAGIEERLKAAIANGDVFISEIFRFKNTKGEYRTFYDRAYIKYDEFKRPLKILGAMQDITEREEAQKQIIENEEKYRTIIEQAADGIFIISESAALLDVNSAGCRMTGYSKAEIQKLKFEDVIPAEDLITNPIRMTLLQKGESVINERRLICKDGAIIDVEISAKKLLDGRYQLFVRDITERKKAEEILLQSEKKYKLLFYDNPMPMWMSSASDLNIIDVNEAAIKQYGYNRDEFLKLNLKDMRPAEDVPYFLSEIENIDLSIKNNRQWRHKKKDGTIIQVEVISNEIIYKGKRVWLSLPHDITEQYLAKELLQKSYTDIRQLASNLQSIREDERTNIAREIHDELGQQLTGLKMDIYWLSKKINTSDNEIAAKLSESIKLINATVASVRKIATDLRPSILDDLGLIAAIEWQGEEFEKRSGTKVEFANEAGDVLFKPDVVTAIFRIYQELLTNVARHANADLVKVLLQKKENSLSFSVTDNGAGFNPETISKKKTLGLLGIKERTLLLGGTYEFKSKPGEGSQTIITIPVVEA
jgi:PAS domain S-box-containing protein